MSQSQSPKRAVVRLIPNSYNLYDKPGRPMSLALAREQHEKYVAALKNAGLQLDVISADENWYDCVFVEDTAVVWGTDVLITRMQGDRSGEHGPVRTHFAKSHRIFELENSRSLLEGGDVLHIDEITYVGLSSRTNREGIEELERFMKAHGREVRTVPVEKCLHLKTGATYLGAGTLLVAPHLIDPQAFHVNKVITCSPTEQNAANIIRIQDSLLISSRYPSTVGHLREFAESYGQKTVGLDMSEFEKGDGSLTCLSIIW